MEELHKLIEQFIASKMAEVMPSFKYSFDPRFPRDFTQPEAPLLSEGGENFCVFDVKISRSLPVSVGGKARRRVGSVNFSIYVDDKQSDRTGYQILDGITSFLERTSYQGVIFRSSSETGNYNVGNWRVNAWTVDFIKTDNI